MCGGKDNDKYKDANLGDPDYKGPPLDEELATGPTEERGCTDIICCFIFILFVLVLGYIFMEGQAKGKPEYLTAAYDGGSKEKLFFVNF